MNKVVFNPLYNKFPRGASKEGEEVSFLLSLANSIVAEEVNFVYISDEFGDEKVVHMSFVDSDENFNRYEAKVVFAKGIYFYHFEILSKQNKVFVCQDELFNGELSEKLTSSFAQVVVVDEKVNVTDGIIYQIVVDRFCKEGNVKPREPFVKRKDWGGNIEKNTTDRVLLNKEVFCGNLKGITSKLQYLKSLGVSILYLSPIFLANSYHKYDTASYMQVDPMFGGEKELKNLVDEGKRVGINIVLDGVFNHTGDDSIYFNKESRYGDVGAYNSKDSKYFDWFKFTLWPEEYACWWGVPTLPEVNAENNDYIDFITGEDGVIEKWMKYGIKGFRLDVVDELPNKFLESVSTKIRKLNKKAYIIGEVWEDASIKISYGERRKYFVDNQIDSVMNYPLKNGILSYVLTGNEREYLKNVSMLLDHYPKSALQNLMNIIGTHDSKRFWSVLEERTQDDEEKFKLLKIATTLQYSFIGNPAIFYGDERELCGGEAPLCRVCFPWNKNGTRGEKWYKFLAKVRKNKALKSGEFDLLFADNGVIVCERKSSNEKILFVTNLSGDDFVVSFDKAQNMIDNQQVEREYVVPNMDIAILKIMEEKK